MTADPALHSALDTKHGASASGPRVLMVTGEFPPAMGGVGDYTALLARHLSALGAHVGILTARNDGEHATNEPGIERVLNGWSIRCWPEVARAVNEGGYRIVHIQYQAAAYGMSGAVNLLPGYLRHALPSARVATTFHDLRVPYLFPKAGPLRRAAVVATDRLSHATVVTNGADLQDLGGRLGRGGRARRWLIPLASSVTCSPPPGYDRDAWRASRLASSPSDLLLAYFGFLNDSKGVDTLVEALAILRSRGIPARLVLVGGETGESDPTNRAFAAKVRAMTDNLGVGRQVVWSGYASSEEVSGHMKAADICVLPFRDGASLRRSSLLTAMEHGIPIVTTPPERPEPLLRNRENVLMVGSGDATALADTVELLWHDDSLKAILADGAVQIAERLGWPEIAADHIRMYQTVLDDTTHGGALELP